MQLCLQNTGQSFAWHSGGPAIRYAAYSVSESVGDKVYQYILGQKEHHQQRSFQEEYDAFLALHGVE